MKTVVVIYILSIFLSVLIVIVSSYGSKEYIALKYPFHLVVFLILIA